MKIRGLQQERDEKCLRGVREEHVESESYHTASTEDKRAGLEVEPVAQGLAKLTFY